MSADHDAFDELAVGWALHALEPEDEAVFARHLPGCARCAETVAETTAVMAAMATDLPQAAPSEGLRSRLQAAVAGTEQVHRAAAPPAQAATVPVPRPSRRALAVALVAAAVATIAGLGIWNVVLGADRRRGSEDGLLLSRRRRDLRGADLAVGDQHRVGERPPDVDAEHAHRRILAAFVGRVRSRVSATWTASSASG